MKTFWSLFGLLFLNLALSSALGSALGSARAQSTRPEIAHQAPASVVAEQSLRLVARARGGTPPLRMTLHLAQSDGAEPVELPMQAAGAGVYSVRVSPQYFSGVDSFRYYLEARDAEGVWTETNWMTVRVIGEAGAAEPDEKSWVRPAVIGGGAALAVGAGVALAGSGGGGGGGGEAENGGGGDEGNPADRVIVRSRSDDVDSPSPGLPKTTVLDVADELAGREIDRVRVRLEFEAVDGGEERVEISYNGSTVLSSTVTNTLVDQVDVLGAADSQVVVRVVESTRDEGTVTYRWTATATFFLK